MVTSFKGFLTFAISNLPRLKPLGQGVTTKINEKKDSLAQFIIAKYILLYLVKIPLKQKPQKNPNLVLTHY